MGILSRFCAALLICLAAYPADAASPGASKERFEVAQATDWAQIQDRLNRLGFDAGPADGQPGARTRYAISAFQSANGRPATGKLSSGDLAVLFGDAASRPQAAVASGSDFEILADTDLPYGDYRSGKDDPGLKNITAEQCLAACAEDGQCQAFTYNVKYKFCFLKETSPSPLPFEGAISGRRVESATGLTMADATSQSRPGLVGAPKGCPAQEAVVTRLRNAMDVSVDTSAATVGGEPVTLSWRRGEFPERLPVYLMVSTGDVPVRFGGKGFYALTPGGKAAFEMQQFAGTSRAVVPLFGADIPAAGSITIEPVTETPLKLQWDVVGMTDCGERAGAPGAAEIAVAAGEPSIIFQNPFSPVTPKERIVSPQGDRTIDIFDGYFRLYDDKGYLLTELSGKQPRFSPTGRFVVAWVAQLTLQVIDGIDGKVMYTYDSVGNAIAWDNADSFAAVSYGAWGRILVSSPLGGEGTVHRVGDRCHACDGASEGLRIDLASNFALTADGAASLTTDFLYITDWLNEQPARQMLPVLRAYSQTADIVLPPDTKSGMDWQFDSPRPFTHTSGGSFYTTGELPDFKNDLEPFELTAITAALDAPLGTGDGSVGQRQDVATRGPTRVAAVEQASGVRRIIDTLPALNLIEGERIAGKGMTLPVLSTEGSVERVEFPGFPKLVVKQSEFGCFAPDDTKADAILSGGYGVYLYETGRFSALYSQCAEGSANFMYSSIFIADRNAPDRVADLYPVVGEDVTNDRCLSVLGLCGFELKQFADRFLVFWSLDSAALAVYDGDKGKVIASYAALPRASLIEDVAIDPTGHWLLLSFAGDLFTIVDLSVGQNADSKMYVDYAHAADPVVAEGMVADGELIVWNNDLQFDATAEGAEFVSVRFAGRSDVYALTQFEGALRRKGMLADLDVGAATSDKSRRLLPPPILSDAKVELSAAGDTIDIKAAWSRPGSLDKLTILQDGLLTDVINVAAAPNGAQFSTPRIRGGKWVTVLAQDADGVVSRPYSTSLGADPRGARPVRLVAIGIDKYADPQLPTLPLARADAVNLEAAFTSLSLVDLVHADRLIDDATGTDAIRAALNAAVDASISDETLVLSLSGHGVQNETGELYLATRDTRLDDLKGTAIAWSEIAGIVARAEGRVVIFLDTCHSGIAGTAYAAPSEGAVEDFLTAIPSNLLIFSASKGRESSQERAELGGGVFTNALIKALGSDRAAADRNGDDSLTISELYGYLRSTVARDTSGQQTPWFARNKMVGDFAVF